VTVAGKASGVHRGRTTLASDGKTIMFLPDIPFSPGEEVNVTIGNGITTQSGEGITPLDFEFTVSSQSASPNTKFLEQLRGEISGTNMAEMPEMRGSVAGQPSPMVRFLPAGFPAINVTTSGATSSGDLFLSNFVFDGSIPNFPYLMILNNQGEPVFYKAMPGICLDFKFQPGGQLTYFDGDSGKFQVMDSAFNVVDSYGTGNGYATDLHEFRLMPNGHGFLLANDAEPIRMDTIVPGGNPGASVIGLIIQEVDEQKNVVFQWRSWDHYAITDSYIDLTVSSVDYVHGNALEIDYDGNLLLSSRHLSEITKINRQTGAIMWRLGGKNNQFTFVNDPTGFSFQHAIRRLENGDIVLFDNGNARVPSYSRAVEYRLDENAKTATLVWQYRNTPDQYGFAMGYVQRFPNSNTLIGWGASNPSVTEVASDGSKAFEMSLPPSVFSYRAYRFPWKDAILSVGIDTLNFENTSVATGAVKEITIRNMTNVSRSITAFATRDTEFTVLTRVPVVIPALDSIAVSVKFLPARFGVITDVLDIRSDSNDEGIVEQIPLIGGATPPTIGTSAAELDFGNIPRGLASTRSIQFSNTSKNVLIIDSIYTRNGLFEVSPTRLVVNDTGSLWISYKPSVQGSFTDVLYLENNSQTPILRIPIFGSSQGLPITDAEAVDFGPDPVQDSVVASVWIHNTLASSLTFVNAFGTNGAFVAKIQFPIVLNSHDSLKVVLGFDPPSFGEYIDTLLFVSDSADVALFASGSSPPPELAASIKQINFGTIQSDSTGEKSIELRDSSVNLLRIDSIYTASKTFSIDHLKMPILLRQADSLKIDVVFSPVAQGTFLDTVYIENNSPQMIAKLALTGVSSPVTSDLHEDLVPKTFTLGQNYPNPFNPSTTIPFGVPTRSNVRIEVYNILGQSIAKLTDRQFGPGYYNIAWDGHAPSGIYLYTMEAISLDDTKSDVLKVMKMLLLK
jgi:hypothetical protein